MHPTLVELLENLKPGLLWVQRDGLVRFANADAVRRTGLVVGRRLYDPDLVKAVAAAVATQTPGAVNAVGGGGGTASEISCRVLPGLSRDDAFVLLAAQKDADTAFDNLMQVIRSDLREPLAQSRQALALMRGHAGVVDHEVEAIGDGLHELLRSLDKLVDLADLWRSGALLANDRIELWPLLQAVWAEVEPLAVQRGLKARLRAQGDARDLATLYGSEHWLRRVFLECLESAVRSSPPGTTLEIEHRQLGPRALIVFRDCGVFAAQEAPGAVPMGGAAAPAAAAAARPALRQAASAAAHAREQIGLKLCQHIVSLHGGQLREEEEDGVRHFLIDLPTGAPHHSDDAQLDIAQAQRYASDLAALMARARTRKTPA